MHLPHCFLADLPPEATLTPDLIQESCRALRRHREQHLLPRSTARIVDLLVELARDWMREDYPFRRLALAEGPARTGFPQATLAAGLDAFFAQLTPAAFEALLTQELGGAGRLDAFEGTPGSAGLARGPELLVHIAAGNLPVPALHSLILGLLARSAQFVKCPQDGAFIPRLFAHSLRETDPQLGGCLELACWPGGTSALEDALFAEADCVTATGRDETLDHIRRRLPLRTRFVGHGHRVSFGYVARDALPPGGAAACAARAADDVAAWNQQGCLSPHVFYVETGAGTAPDQFAALLGAELERREASSPRGAITIEESAVISLKRDFYRVRMAAACETRVWHSEDSTAWTVVFEGDPLFQASCLNRFIYVKPVANLEEALRAADAVRGQVSTVGLAAGPARLAELAATLARWGATRVCPLGRMQRPPLTWRQDGRPTLGDLIQWTHWEH